MKTAPVVGRLESERKKSAMNSPSESSIQSAIMDWLIWQKYLIVRANGGAMKAQNKDGSERHVRFGYWSALGDTDNTKGVSDILACSPDGVFCAFEVKVPGKEATEPQSRFLKEVEKRDGIFGVVTSIDDVEKLLGVES